MIYRELLVIFSLLISIPTEALNIVLKLGGIQEKSYNIYCHTNAHCEVYIYQQCEKVYFDYQFLPFWV